MLQTNYMAVEIVDGKVVFKFDLGSGRAVITADKNVVDGQWHEVIAQRSKRFIWQ